MVPLLKMLSRCESVFILLLLLTACGGGSSNGDSNNKDAYTIGGTVSGLTGDGLVLQNNGEDSLSVTDNGSFSFAIKLSDGVAYEVTIDTQPSGQVCVVNNGAGILSGADISGVEINCSMQMPVLNVSVADAKLIRFAWDDIGADHYRLLKNSDGISGYSQIGPDLMVTLVEEEIPVHLQDWLNASYLLQACSQDGQCIDSEAVTVSSLMLDVIGYLKGYETTWEDHFGSAVEISGDGMTLAIGVPGDLSPATGIDGEWGYSPDYQMHAGAVYVFALIDGRWQRQAYIKSSNTAKDDYFGAEISLSYDGDSLAVGAAGEDSAAIGVDGNQQDNSAPASGAVYLFTRVDESWSQLAYLKASDSSAGGGFGRSLSFSASGELLGVGADKKAYLFQLAQSAISELAVVESAYQQDDDNFAATIQLSGDGTTLAVGAPNEASSSIGIDGDESDNGAAQSGAVYLFVEEGGVWSRQAYIKSSNSDAGDRFGSSLSMTEDGNLLVVGARGEDSSASGAGGDETDDSAEDSGAVYLFERSNSQWVQSGYMKASNSGSGDYFGHQVAISGDGLYFAVSATGEDSIARGINGDQADDSASAPPGAVYQFSRDTRQSQWRQTAYVKAPDTTSGWETPVCSIICGIENDEFGADLDISYDGSALVVGAPSENSGKSDDMEDTSVPNNGAAYLY